MKMINADDVKKIRDEWNHDMTAIEVNCCGDNCINEGVACDDVCPLGQGLQDLGCTRAHLNKLIATATSQPSPGDTVPFNRVRDVLQEHCTPALYEGLMDLITEATPPEPQVPSHIDFTCHICHKDYTVYETALEDMRFVYVRCSGPTVPLAVVEKVTSLASEQGCQDSYRGGYSKPDDEDKLNAFHHGIRTGFRCISAALAPYRPAPKPAAAEPVVPTREQIKAILDNFIGWYWHPTDAGKPGNVFHRRHNRTKPEDERENWLEHFLNYCPVPYRPKPDVACTCPNPEKPEHDCPAWHEVGPGHEKHPAPEPADAPVTVPTMEERAAWWATAGYCQCISDPLCLVHDLAETFAGTHNDDICQWLARDGEGGVGDG